MLVVHTLGVVCRRTGLEIGGPSDKDKLGDFRISEPRRSMFSGLLNFSNSAAYVNHRSRAHVYLTGHMSYTRRRSVCSVIYQSINSVSAGQKC